jgi:lambda repressor-like predicted transcriptional regulator
LPEKTLTGEHQRAVADAVWARLADLQWSVRRLGQLSGLSVNTIKGVLHAKGHPHKSTLVALSAVLGWDPQHLSGIAHGKAPANLTRESLLLLKQICGLRADIAGLTEGTRRTGMKIDILIDRIDTLIGAGDPAR